MDLRRQIALLWRWAWLIVLITTSGAVLVYAYSNSLPKSYEAQATLIVGQSLTSSSLDYNALLAAQSLSQTYATVATTRPILERVAELEGSSFTADDLQQRVFAVAPRASTLITITVADGDPERAARLANEVADQLIAASPAIQGRQEDVQNFVDQQVSATEHDINVTQTAVQQLIALTAPTDQELQQLQVLQNRLATLRSAYSTLLGFSSKGQANTLTLIEPATPPPFPSSPRVLVNTLLAAAAALALAVGLVFLGEHLDDTVKTGLDVEESTSAASFGFIPNVGGRRGRDRRCLPTVDMPRSAASEAFRSLRTNLEFARVDLPLKRILITSSVPGEGKTTVAANLAVAFAQAGRRTLLVDADLRKPGVHRVFQLANSQGLTSLIKSKDVSAARNTQQTDTTNLTALTSGPLPPNPADVLGSQRFKAILEELDQLADVIVIDGPPVSGLADAAIMSTMVDGTLVVVRSGKTRRDTLRHAFEMLLKACLLGCGQLGDYAFVRLP